MTETPANSTEPSEGELEGLVAWERDVIDWPVYYRNGHTVDEDDFATVYYRVSGPNGPVSYLTKKREAPIEMTMHGLLMEAESDPLESVAYEDTPFADDAIDADATPKPPSEAVADELANIADAWGVEQVYLSFTPTVEADRWMISTSTSEGLPTDTLERTVRGDTLHETINAAQTNAEST